METAPGQDGVRQPVEPLGHRTRHNAMRSAIEGSGHGAEADVLVRDLAALAARLDRDALKARAGLTEGDDM
jgi:hypothetical protein